MNTRLQTPVNAVPKPSFTPVRSNLLQRRCACGGTPGLDGECAACRQKRLARRRSASPAAEPATAPPIVHEVLRSPGQPLDAATRAFMEPRFGHDFSRVRVHSDAKAAESAGAVGAAAYTVGRDVVFGARLYRPGTSEGRKLLAHELTHTIQQGMRDGGEADTLEITDKADAAEGEAEATADALLQNQPIAPARAAMPRIARQETAAPATPASPIRTVKVWINAFIPQDVPGKTEPAPAPHTGKTMLRGPIPGVSDCFLTDNRDFDSNIHAPSRMHSEIEIDVAGPTENFQWHNCDETHEIDCEDGDAECTQKGSTARMSFANLRGSSTSTIFVNIKAAANNPCVSGSPDIDYDGIIAINVSTRRVAFSGAIDQFPAFEMYATANGGAGVTMFRTMPLAGKDPWNLPGAANRAQDGAAAI